MPFRSLLAPAVGLVALVPLASSQCETGHLVASNNATWDQFGAAVALAGDTALIGAWSNAAGMPSDRNTSPG